MMMMMMMMKARFIGIIDKIQRQNKYAFSRFFEG